MSVIHDEEGVRTAYEKVRNDKDLITWIALDYKGKQIKFFKEGTDYAELIDLLGEDQRIYAYVRFETGDEMSKRAKFAFITWIGPAVSPLKKAKVSTDKAFVKKIFVNFGKEILADEKCEFRYETILKQLEAASGAAYGTGK